MDPKWTRIDPDLNDPEEDREKYREEHRRLFGHEPPADPDEKCEHPSHAAIRRTMNGATIITPFDGNEIITEDSEYEKAARERYGVVFRMTQAFQKEVEAADRYQRERGNGLILPS